MPIIMLPSPVTPETHVLVDADGVAHEFTGLNGFAVAVGSSFGQMGRFRAPVTVMEDQIPIYRGSRVRGVKEQASTMTIPIWIFGETAAQRHGRMRELVRWMRTPHGYPATWRNTSIDGVTRETPVYYAGGLEGDESMSAVNQQSALVTVDLLAPDGCWYDATEMLETFTLADVPVASFFKTPFFPIRLSSSTVLSDTTVNNNGDLEAWPIWTITGPGGPSIVLRNVTTDAVTTITRTLTGAQQIIVDTRPGYKTATDGLGTSLYSALNGSEMWSLARGLNRIQVEVSSATADTVVEMAYKRAWNSP